VESVLLAEHTVMWHMDMLRGAATDIGQLFPGSGNPERSSSDTYRELHWTTPRISVPKEKGNVVVLEVDGKTILKRIQDFRVVDW